MGQGDEYLWLENLDNPETMRFVEEMNRETRRILGRCSDKLYPRMLKYYSRPDILDIAATQKGYLALYRSRINYVDYVYRDGERRRLVSSQELGRDVAIHSIHASRDGGLAAYFYSRAGSDEGVLRIVDAETGEEVDRVEGSVEGPVWIDKYRYYYVRMYRKGYTPDGVKAPAERVILRTVGVGEEVVFGEGLPSSYFVGMLESFDASWVGLVVSYGWSSATIYSGPKTRPEEWEKIYESKALSFPVDCGPWGCIVVDREGGRGLGRIILVGKDSRDVLVDEGRDTLRWAAPVDEGLLAVYFSNASAYAVLYDRRGRRLGDYRFDEPASLYSPSTMPGEALFLYTSFTTPYMVLRFTGKGFERLEGERLLDLEVRDEWAVSADGTRIHMFLVHRPGVRPRGVMLYGYGGFNIALTPRFITPAVPLLEDGAALAVANLRGGGEYGENWHRAGMRENKVKVFEDFAACAKRLRELGFEKIVAWGASNGGLLVAATMVRYPEAFDGALIGYPVLDMLRFHKLYIGAAWIPEYGNPEDPRDRRFLEEYSPYHNLRRDAHYPETMIYTGLHDDRVHPGHAFKFAAKMRDLGHRVLLRVEESSGHLGATPEVKAREAADIMAFAYRILGLGEC